MNGFNARELLINKNKKTNVFRYRYFLNSQVKFSAPTFLVKAVFARTAGAAQSLEESVRVTATQASTTFSDPEYVVSWKKEKVKL